MPPHPVVRSVLLCVVLSFAAMTGLSFLGYAGYPLAMYELLEEWDLEWLGSLLTGGLTLGTLALPLLLIYFVRGQNLGLPLFTSAAKRAQQHNTAGVDLYKRRAYQAAVVEFDKALRLNPQLGTAYYNRGTAYLELAELDEAERDLQTSLPLAKNAARVHLALANLWHRRGDLNRALLECNKALELDPADGAALTSRGNLWHLQHDLERAAADFDRALFYSPRLGLAYRGRAQLRLAQGRSEEALADLQQALAFGGDGLDFALRARVWLERQDYERALADLNTAMEEGIRDAAAYRDRALAWLMLDKYPQAIADATEAIRLAPNDAIAFNNRGTAHFRTGAYAQALADLTKARELDPNLPHVYKNLAWLQATCPLAEYRNGAEAVANATRALELTQWKASMWLNILAAAHAEAGQFDDAVRRQLEFVPVATPAFQGVAQEQLELYRAGKPFRV